MARAWHEATTYSRHCGISDKLSLWAHQMPAPLHADAHLLARMSAMSSKIERRQFGRRTVTRHGWIQVPGRPKIPCTVSNVSAAGALLELDAPKWLPFQFHLLISGIEQATLCEIRHASPNRIGVTFVEATTAIPPRRGAVSEIEQWTGEMPAKNRSTQLSTRPGKIS